jgi:hypothetical protein
VAVGVTQAERADSHDMEAAAWPVADSTSGVPNLKAQVVSQPAVAARSGTIGSASTCVQSR